MADLTPPYLDPSQYPAFLDAQRKQQLAQMLMGSLQQANQTPASWDSMKVVPKRGMLQNVSALADALLAGKAQKQATTAQQQYFQGLYGQPSTQAPATGPGAGIISPDAPQDQQDAAQAVTNTPPKSGLVQQPQNPMILGGMNKGTAQGLLSMMGPEKYGELLASQYKPSEIATQLRNAGIDPNGALGKQIQQQAIAKATNIAPVDVRPGGTLVDPITHQPIMSAPNSGIQTTWGPNGPSQSVVPGADTAAAQMTGAETGAKTANTPIAIPTAGGGSTFGYPGDKLGVAPPALRTPQSAAASPPSAAAPGGGGGPGVTPNPSPSSPSKPQDPWVSIPKLKVSSALGAPDDFTKGVLQAAGAKHAELSTKYGEESNLADQKLQYNAEARAALPNAEVGPMSEWLTHNRARLMELGVPDKLIPGDGTVTPTLELNKNLKNAALQGAKATFGAKMTQNEVMLQHEELSPSTSMTRDAISSLMNQDDIKQQYAKQRAEDYGKYVQGGGDPLRFESWYSKTFPLTEFARAHSPTPTAPAPAVSHPPEDLAAEMKRRGLLK